MITKEENEVLSLAVNCYGFILKTDKQYNIDQFISEIKKHYEENPRVKYICEVLNRFDGSIIQNVFGKVFLTVQKR